MRHLSVPGRLAVAFAASLALASSAGCMSVSDDKSGSPAPSKSDDRPDTAPEPDGGHVGPGGGRHAGGRPAVSPGRSGERERAAVPKPPASPSGGATAAARSTPKPSTGPVRPKPAGPTPEPTQTPSATPVPPSSTPPPKETPTSEPPKETPTEQPTEPTEQPSASSAPEVHAGAMRTAEAYGRGMRGEPMASPRLGPV
ncbi:hypothetical protein [Streptomyces inusitatus]|uniref:hypothetical protein n=1 Tax=Streptomyces inusitatus TaxID=68221 RepID=UPI00167F1BDE|nr:hypothetical protein [Streptomyces inusitatus]